MLREVKCRIEVLILADMITLVIYFLAFFSELPFVYF